MYRYKESEVKKILKNLVIIVDSREKNNGEIIKYFEDNKINYVIQAQNTGDYGCYIKACPEFGIMRDLEIPAKVEKKSGVDELASNLQKSTEVRFVNELLRSKDIPFTLIIEGKDAYRKLINGQYRSAYKPLSLLARLNTLKVRYGFEYVFLDKDLMGHWLVFHFYYHARGYLENFPTEFSKPEITST